MTVEKLITDHIDIWSSALQTRSTAGRGSNGKIDLYGIKKLRELILELAVRGKLVAQDPNDEPASELLKRIAAEKAELVKQGKIKKQKPLPEISEDEKPFELPVGWEWVRLGTLGYTQTGGTPSKSNAEYYGNDIPFIKPADITAQGVIYDNEGLSIKGAETLGRVAPSGSILMVCIGTIGKCQIINRTCSFNQQINSITPFSDISDFIYLDVSSSYFQSLAWDYSSSTTIAILNKGKWESLLVPIAPLSEQARIVTNVKKLMSLCDQLEQQSLTSLDANQQLVETLLSTLTDSQNAEELAENWARISQHFDTLFNTEASIEALKQTILQLAVMGKLVPQDPNDEPASELLKRIEQEKAQLVKEGKIKKQKLLPPVSDEEKPFELPEGWEWCRVSNVAMFTTSGSRDWAKYYSEKGALFVTMGNLSRGSYDLRMDNIRYVSPPTEGEGLRTRLEAFDLIISITGDVGNLGLIPDGFGEAYINQHTCLLRFIPTCQNYYFAEFMRSPVAKVQFDAPQRGIKNSFRLSDVEEMYLPLPPLKEQYRIAEKIKECLSICDQIKSRLHSAQQTQLHLADAITDAALN
ncbi:restriction endonuclease subunit S [Enterobacter cloacae]|uniref:restriction endonuclease subunit S n=1 Tax=Enterobacter cloacae TaxID=550 RepID=UPI0021CFBA4B|nr:restriction endonuclease subunit S [Enterobacter cloacae]ELE9012606.1 restriction endonuclease subunit S [Enterobacter cloacae]MCU6202509.1 restriction endonuclease subunit S [Enterobacter cloacae]MDR9930973.1 restriction endonuclease subunit S [Enterobacter cloacae subsp. dissolvens]